MGCYIVEFEQNGEDRAAYGEQLLKKLEKQLNTKGLNERRFREFRLLPDIFVVHNTPLSGNNNKSLGRRRKLDSLSGMKSSLRLSLNRTKCVGFGNSAVADRRI